MSSDDKPATTQVTTQSTAPWSGVQPYLERGYEQAENLFMDNTREFYPNSTVVPFNQATEAGLQRMEQRATSGSPVVQAAQQQVQQTAGGDYLQQGNPYLQKAISDATQPLVTQFQEDIIPGIQSGFSNAGRYGSGLQARQQERAGEVTAREMGKIATQMGMQSYGDERQRQLQAASLAPQMAAQDYTDIAAQMNVGETREAQAGAELAEDISRFQFAQDAPREDLARYMALVGGGGYTDTSTATPLYRNKTNDFLGAAATTAGIAGTLFGRNGIWPA